MKKRTTEHSKELYRAFRRMSFDRLWNMERVAFEKATDCDRQTRVVLVRALTAAAQEDGRRCEMVKSWVLSLLEDDSEKVRRYAVNALPKLHSGEKEESLLLGLLEKSKSQRERECVLEALGKIGGSASLGVLGRYGEKTAIIKQRVLAGLARKTGSGRLDLDSYFKNEKVPGSLLLHLRCRKGLEQVLREEVEASAEKQMWFRLQRSKPGLLVLAVVRPFCLRQILKWRCWHGVGFVLGEIPEWENSGGHLLIGKLVASELAEEIGCSLTKGVARYRLELVGRGARRGFVKDVVESASISGSALINDTRQALWSVDVFPPEQGGVVELRPRLVPDPRFCYRVADVPAASHPPLAAALARLASPKAGDVVWDPFCGSGVELVECAFAAGDLLLIGTDVSKTALESARKNLAAAGVSSEKTKLFEMDFRDEKNLSILKNGADVIVTNPPMGRRVPVGEPARLIGELFSVARMLLRDGGRLALVNPLKNYTAPSTLLLMRRYQVDMGGFDGWLELYAKSRGKC